MAEHLEHWRVEYRPGGWARARKGDLTAYLKLFREPTGKLRIHLVTLVAADMLLTEAKWKSVPLREIELSLAALSGVTSDEIDRTVNALAGHVVIDGYSPDALERYFSATDELPVVGIIPVRPGLSRPTDGRLTDEFLGEVAQMYLALAGEKRAPAPAIADAAGVPVRTVHRWVSEARKRDLLPPATRGRAG